MRYRPFYRPFSLETWVILRESINVTWKVSATPVPLYKATFSFKQKSTACRKLYFLPEYQYFKFNMPKVLFTDDLECRLIELWEEYQRTKSGTMMKRSVADRQIASKMNDYVQHLGIKDFVFTAASVHSKVEHLKTKARDLYKRYRKKRKPVLLLSPWPRFCLRPADCFCHMDQVVAQYVQVCSWLQASAEY